MDSLHNSVNPFVHRIRFRAADYVRVTTLSSVFDPASLLTHSLHQIGIASFTLVPVRFCMSFLLFLMACASASVAYLLLTLSGLKGDQREKARKRFLRLPLVLLRAMLFVSGIDCIDYKDSPGSNDKAAPILLFVPHTSFFDLYPGIFLPDVPSWVARAEAQNFLFFRQFLMLAGMIFVKRESDSSRKETIDSITTAAAHNRIAICPEGTCCNGSKLLRFKSGAFAPGLPVQPMVIKYTNSSGMDTTSWTYDGLSFFTITWLTLCNLWTRIEVTKLPAYFPNQEEKSDARLFADNVRKYVSQKTGIPTTPFIFDDVYFFEVAKASAIPRTPICIKLLKIAHKTAVEREGAQKQEVTAETLGGLRSEDGNLLFDSSDDRRRRHKDLTLQVLREMTASLKSSLQSLPIDSPINVAELTLKASTSSSLSIKSNALHELEECVQGVDGRSCLMIAATLCDLSQPFLWDRIKLCTDTLALGSDNPLSPDDVKCLLWALLGVRDKQVQDIQAVSSEVNFVFLRRHLARMFPQAVSEAIS